ncbi:MAG TPA: serine/threonine-protein kinase, partial [Kofleriaceae bacterium]|nr:serine/threonine-protein kinase [Kofleriaceae bacterium]
MSEGSPPEEFGPYLVYEQLGVGGMAQVHRAVAASDEFQRPVALKRMLSHIAGSEDMVKSFVREARLASYLRHENVAQTYDLGRVGDTYFIVMELITGRNLREVLRHCGVTTGPMPVQFALAILNQICDALDYAHNLCDDTGQPLGIIHRDVSPSNVIVSETGVVKLIDFGIAKASGGGMQTMSGTLKGKFAYMAPEYIGGRIDARADLFAVGVIAHELLTNRPLFSGRDDIDTLSRVRDMPIAPPSKKNPQVPPEIDDIVMTALERDPERRWQHATALRSALTTLTRRLGLIASNAQVVHWLDWAFSQPPKRRPRRAGTETDPDPDTDTDADAVADETADAPGLSSEQETVEHRTIKQRAPGKPTVEPPSLTLSSASKKITLIRGGGGSDPAPPNKPRAGTPGSVPAQTSSAQAASPPTAA